MYKIKSKFICQSPYFVTALFRGWKGYFLSYLFSNIYHHIIAIKHDAYEITQFDYETIVYHCTYAKLTASRCKFMLSIMKSWWRHQMETFSALLAICAGNSPVPGEFPAQRQVTRRFNVFCDLRLNKRLRKQSWGWWFETLSRPLWRHCNVENEAPVAAAQWPNLTSTKQHRIYSIGPLSAHRSIVNRHA